MKGKDPAAGGALEGGRGRRGPEDPVEVLASKIAALHLETAAVFFLELSKPVSFMASQAMIFLGPLVQALFPGKDLKRFAALFEDRREVERLIRAVEEKARRDPEMPSPPEDGKERGEDGRGRRS